MILAKKLTRFYQVGNSDEVKNKIDLYRLTSRHVTSHTLIPLQNL